MKKILAASLATLALAGFGASQIFGTTAQAMDTEYGVGIIVKTGTHMDTLLANNFSLVTENCDPNDQSTSTPPQQCEHSYYHGHLANVYFAVARQTNNRPFRESLGVFPFQGSIDYVNKNTDAEVEASLVQMMLQGGNSVYDIVYEQ